ncbi:hypothetical protein EI74_0531 [Mycoplasma testudineum]|uniref:Uncharacterized protein n=1 Tax=Mycoplasma testudineum TaxID=244584 RepID=A0A4R6ID20_9MOLU|nr:hypothetical protein [Mycoplasma testudineum]OYD26756.1 hypothetical protein CG473_02260 [Mycoplasma testudineum]TDO19892.1 hypothetical protein EI74_0531 [Mycoplasma testudineum]
MKRKILIISSLISGAVLAGIGTSVAVPVITSYSNNLNIQNNVNFEKAKNIYNDMFINNYGNSQATINSNFNKVADNKIIINASREQETKIIDFMSNIMVASESNDFGIDKFINIAKSMNLNIDENEIRNSINEYSANEKREIPIQLTNSVEIEKSILFRSKAKDLNDAKYEINKFIDVLVGAVAISWTVAAGYWAAAWFFGLSIPAAVAVSAFATGATAALVVIKNEYNNLQDNLNKLLDNATKITNTSIELLEAVNGLLGIAISLGQASIGLQPLAAAAVWAQPALVVLMVALGTFTITMGLFQDNIHSIINSINK